MFDSQITRPDAAVQPVILDYIAFRVNGGLFIAKRRYYRQLQP